MKKCVVATLAIVLVSLSALQVLHAQAVLLKVAVSEGKVLIKSAGGEWMPAKAGQTLSQNDVVKTEDDGKIILEFPDRSSFTIKPNSQLTIDEIVWDNTVRKVSVNLTAGELKTIIQKVNTPSEFKVRTPTAVCGARGTVFYVAVLADGTSVYVDEGSVDFLNSMNYESYTILQGNTSMVNADGTMVPPRELTAQEKADLLSSWGVANVPVAETYTEPPAPPIGVNDITPPNVTQEDQASRT